MPEKILIVDDDVDTLRLVGLMLQRQGYQIVAANNGHQALVIAQSEKPDLILLDIMMPDMDGYEVTRRLRSNTSTSAIPIIMFTAKSQVDDKVSGFEVGADDYLTKPTQPRELFAHVKAVLSRGSKVRVPTATLGGDRGHVVGVLAAKGGLGASTLCANLGITLRARSKKEVIVAEFRPGEGSISLDLGYTRPEGLNRLFQRKTSEITPAEVEKELVTHNSGVRLLLASYLPQDARYINCVDVFEAITHQLAYMAAYIVLDLGPAITPVTDKILGLCDDLIVVIEPIPYTVLRTKALIELLLERGFGDGRTNLVLVTRNRSELQLSWTQVKEQLGHDLAVSFTPAPELTYQAARNNVPIVVQQPDSLTSQQFGKLSEIIAKHVRQKA
jgi:DNA-binding response OmpR family regulator